MINSPENSLPKHLKDLLAPTSLGATKLIEAWDSLSPESQIQILSQITDEKSQYPKYLLNKIRLKALNSTSTYIRHLATRGFSFYESDGDNEDKVKINQLIENDPSPLVKFSKISFDLSVNRLNESPEKFFELPQLARLTSIFNLDSGVASNLVEVLNCGVKKIEEGTLTDEELFHIVTEFLNKKEFNNAFDSPNPNRGSSVYLSGKNLEDLWGLAIKVPEGVSYLLIENLPTEAGFSTETPKDVLNHLNENQLRRLFERSDVELTKFRKKIFYEKLNDDSSPLLWAALGHNFDLTNKEFSEILKKPKQEKRRTVALLGQACNHLRPCIFQACFDFISTLGYSNREKYNIEWIEENLKLRYKNLDEYYKLRNEKFLKYNRDKEIIELKLYEMAKLAVPWQEGETGYLPSNQSSGYEELKILDEIVIKGDTWATFMAFSDAWKKLDYRKQENIKKHLPNVLDESREVEDEAEDDFDDIFQKENFPETKEINSLLKTQWRLINYSVLVTILLIILYFVKF